jgi:beta-mannosidase
MRFNLLLLLLILLSLQLHAQTKRNLHEGWSFKKMGSDSFFKAQVPGSVQADLIRANQIPHPWYGQNEKEIQWVENEDWVYKNQFSLSDKDLTADDIEINFEGLDTYAEVYLNGAQIIEANNMFRTWKKKIKNLLQPGINEIEIHFFSPIKRNIKELSSYPHRLPAGSETGTYQVSPYVRKAAYHFGWDWGPRIVCMGIWKPVYLEFHRKAYFEKVHVIQTKLNPEEAELEFHLHIHCFRDQNLSLQIQQEKYPVQLKNGIQEIKKTIRIKKPQLWWPNGYGEPHLYNFPVYIKENAVVIDSHSQVWGFRTVDLIQEEDSIGQSFYFKINGKKIFAKGANYIPQTHFLSEINQTNYKNIIHDARQCQMNMLRVWGGGIYENDHFYNYCDSMGIMVWQDFMFAGSLYPELKSFQDNIEYEVKENVERLHLHPSIVHWNGNNEIEVAWFNWGWQKTYGYTVQDSIQIYKYYQEIFQNKIKFWLQSIIPNATYTHTSPLSNWGKKENFNRGSMHYWGVWHGGDSFPQYREYVGRFMAEYGFQSFPNPEVIETYCGYFPENEHDECISHLQKSYVGNSMIRKQIETHFDSILSFKDFIYKSQEAQALAMQIAIDAHRLKKKSCGGTLFWQYNDCWPGISWSCRDFSGQAKKIMQLLPTLYAPIAIIPEVSQQKTTLHLLNDRFEELNLEIKIFKNDQLVVQKRINVAADSLQILDTFENFNSLTAEIYQDQKLIFTRNFK